LGPFQESLSARSINWFPYHGRKTAQENPIAPTVAFNGFWSRYLGEPPITL
jgi:hypothetical protein